MKLLKMGLVSVFIFSSLAASAASKTASASTISMLALCIYTPASDQQSSSLPAFPVGFLLAKESLNNSEVSVDFYKLDSSNKLIKLIGHGELVSTSSTAVEVLDVAADSPFDFQLSFGKNVSTLAAGTQVSGTMNIATTFVDQTYNDIPVTCKLGAGQ